MSLETLLAAAQYVEQQDQLKQKNNELLPNVVVAAPTCEPTTVVEVPQTSFHVAVPLRSSETRVVTPSLETITLHAPPTPPTPPARETLSQSPLTLNQKYAQSMLSLLKLRNGEPSVLLSHDDGGINGEHKRRSGTSLSRAGTREVHNKLEKNRRAHLKECFDGLKRLLPRQGDEKKSSNLSILHSALRYIQSLKRKEREYEHEMERLALDKIAAQKKLVTLKKELSLQWDHIDFNKLLPNQLEPVVPMVYSTDSIHNNGSNLSDIDENGVSSATTYSSTSSLSSATTTSSQIVSPILQIPAATVSVMQSNAASAPMVIQATLPEVSNGKVTSSASGPTSVLHPTIHLPLTQVMGAQGFVVSPTIQLVTTGTQGLRVLQPNGTERQLTLLQTPNADRPLALVQTSAGTAHHIDLNSTGVTQSNGLQEAVVSTTAATPLHKIVPSSVTLMSTAPGNNFRALPKGLTIQNGISLCSTAVSLASIKKSNSNENPTAGVADIVTAHSPMSGLTSVAPLVVSQGNQLTHIIGTTHINGKVTPLIKTVGHQVPLVNTQYLSAAAFVKPEVVVNNSTATSAATVTSSTVVSLPPTSS